MFWPIRENSNDTSANGTIVKGWDEFSPAYKSILESDYTFIEDKNELFIVNISKDGGMAWANTIVILISEG